MTFEQFRATRRAMTAQAFGEIVQDSMFDDFDSGVLAYGTEETGFFYIETLRDGSHALTLYSEQYTGDGSDSDLIALESRLYEFAVQETDSFRAAAEPVKLASEFARLIRTELAPHLPEIVARNAAPEYGGACATHDHCDANAIMAEAFNSVTGRDSNPASESDAALWNAAWTLARARGFAA